MRRKYISPKSEKERYIMTFSLFEKEIHYIWEGNIYENSKKDLRRWEGSKKEIHSARKIDMSDNDYISNDWMAKTWKSLTFM